MKKEYVFDDAKKRFYEIVGKLKDYWIIIDDSEGRTYSSFEKYQEWEEFKNIVFEYFGEEPHTKLFDVLDIEEFRQDGRMPEIFTDFDIVLFELEQEIK